MTKIEKLRQQLEDLNRKISEEERRQIAEIEESPDKYDYHCVGVANDYGDLRVLFATQSGNLFFVDMNRIDARGLFESLQRELSRSPKMHRT